MAIVSISNSGTAWLRDMAAQGKNPTGGGWANSPNAAYYASLDSDNAPASTPSTSAKALPSSLEELIKMQKEAAKKDDEDELTEEIHKQIDKVASDGIPMTGNIVNTKA